MRCAAYIGTTSTRTDPRCPNEGTHEEWTEPYGDGRKVLIAWCEFHWGYYDKNLESFERALLRADIRAGNTEAAEMQLERVKAIEPDGAA